jgi:CIC family chloride channel protein
VETFAMNAPLSRVMELIPVTTQTVFPVTDKDGNYCALFSLNQVRRVLYEKEFGRFAIVADIAVQTVEPLRLDTDVSTVLVDFARMDFEELPVVDSGSQKKIIGLLRRQDVIAAYNKKLSEVQTCQT